MTTLEIVTQMHEMGASRTSATQMLKAQGIKVFDEELDEVYGEKSAAKADWEERVRRLRQLTKGDFTQKQMAEICVSEGLFGGMASAKQCMPYINMAVEWAAQEVAEQEVAEQE